MTIIIIGLVADPASGKRPILRLFELPDLSIFINYKDLKGTVSVTAAENQRYQLEAEIIGRFSRTNCPLKKIKISHENFEHDAYIYPPCDWLNEGIEIAKEKRVYELMINLILGIMEYPSLKMVLIPTVATDEDGNVFTTESIVAESFFTLAARKNWTHIENAEGLALSPEESFYQSLFIGLIFAGDVNLYLNVGNFIESYNNVEFFCDRGTVRGVLFDFNHSRLIESFFTESDTRNLVSKNKERIKQAAQKCAHEACVVIANRFVQGLTHAERYVKSTIEKDEENSFYGRLYRWIGEYKNLVCSSIEPLPSTCLM